MIPKAGRNYPNKTFFRSSQNLQQFFHKLPCESVAFFGHDRPRHSNAQTKNS